MKKFLPLLLLFISFGINAQVGSINFSVFDEFSKKPVESTLKRLNSTDSITGNGNIQLNNIPSGSYTFQISAENYETVYLNDISIIPNQNVSFSVGLNKAQEKSIQEVIITKKTYKTTAESPVSLRNITSEEVQKSAGANRDISRAILSFPGVGSSATFRNDLFIRGGSSAENKFYIDGIEVPIINHFQTQGASGGPRGIITIDFIKDVDFYSGAFPTRGNRVHPRFCIF